MVLKRDRRDDYTLRWFENDVKVDGTQTSDQVQQVERPFENDVKVDGTQTVENAIKDNGRFENDVKVDGTQTEQLH